MIFDGPKAFPNSVVTYTWFSSHELRQLIAYLRDSEALLQKEIAALGPNGEAEKVRSKIVDGDYPDKFRLVLRTVELLMVERHLIWMVSNVTGSPEERALRRRGFGSDEYTRMADEPTEWDEQKIDETLGRILGG